MVAYVVTFILLLIVGNTVEGKDGGADYFAADKVWLYITLLTVGYMISRDPYWAERVDRNADR